MLSNSGLRDIGLSWQTTRMQLEQQRARNEITEREMQIRALRLELENYRAATMRGKT
ncbi:hypothetical protein [Bartonella schoenbuchensis]|uniref:hypothetical protein n=1 Tax=Bartonella schoenbuchensis TaxID=165694 RepID=UPI0031453747